MVTIPYVPGMSECMRKACEKFDLKVAFKSGQAFRSLLTRVKDPLPMDGEASLAIRSLPVWTQRWLEIEYKDTCCRDTLRSLPSLHEHAWNQQHTIDWEDTKVLNKATQPDQLVVKEALCI